MILQLSTTYTDPVPQTPHLLNHGRWSHQANELKPYCELMNHQNLRLRFWNSHSSACNKAIPVHAIQSAQGWWLILSFTYL